MLQESKKLLVLVVGLSILLNACGKKDEKKEELQSAPTTTTSAPTTPTAPVAPPAPPPPSLPAVFEGASGGTPLTSSTAKASFDLMAKNLGGTKWAKVNFQSNYDYIVKNLYVQGETPVFTKSEGSVNTLSGSFPVPKYHMAAMGYGKALTIQLEGNYVDPGNTFVFQSSIKIGQLTLYSTDSVALFVSNGGFTYEVLKINYSTTTPVVQRFKIVEAGQYGNQFRWNITQQNYETIVEFAPNNN